MSSIENQYNEQQEDQYAEFLEFKEKRNRELGLQVDGSPLGDSVHKLTIKSYQKLKQPVPDSVRLATLRPNEKMLKQITELKGKLPEIKTTITKVMRLLDKETSKQYLIFDKTIEFLDLNGNVHRSDYINNLCHPEAEGRVLRNPQYQITGSEITGIKNVYDQPWSKAEFEKLLETDVNKGKGTQFIISYAKPKGGGSTYNEKEMCFSIKNAEDFAIGKFEELVELGRRALSGTTPSLKKLLQPISEDSNISLEKKSRGYIDPSKISFSQGTGYR